MESFMVAACDLDKTLYPPAGPEQGTQLKANITGMNAFESMGGFVFPVTGNNLLMAQKKFMDPEDETRMLRDLRTVPGIYTNGGLVLGPNGKEIEKHALGRLILQGRTDGLDFVTAMLIFFDDASLKASVLQNVGMLLLAPEYIGGYDASYSNVDGYAASQRVSARKMSREDIIAAKGDILLILLLFPPISEEKDARQAKEEYDSVIHPQQLQILEEMKVYGLMNCMYADGKSEGLGEGIKVTPMKDPWPEIDINVAGVDKGKALARFLQNSQVLEYLGQRSIDPSSQVAVFGDAPNDVPMFMAVAGVQPGLRVVMPHADDKILNELSNTKAEVADVLQMICKAKRDLAQIRGTG
ncbi:unnamed protein product [Polarella glacialis]|uniref:Haloacid dehalogenase-like hydrolase n=1 Tax=Polarella glacialis TaxID=89957 RepID=A0A813L6K3_POLGL|nr:unnamed protein product [Polarella glacialis]